jgi:hypothetical protein
LLSAVFLVITASSTAGKIGSYLVLGLSCFAAYYFTLRYVPETKDRSVDQCVALVLASRQPAQEPGIQLTDKILI